MKNLLDVAKANTKKLEATTKKQIASDLKEFKKIQAENTKAIKSEKSIESEKIKLDWLNDTQSKTALENYVKNNVAKIQVFLELTNKLNNSKIEISQVNKQLFKFGYFHELNKLDYDGNIIEAKSFFNISFFVANSNSLLNRFAKFENITNEKFIKASKLSTQNYLDSKFKAITKKVLSDGGDAKKVATILKNTKTNRTQKVELLKALITE